MPMQTIPFIFDPFAQDNLNSNLTVMGRSGSGKTVAVKSLIVKSVNQGIPVSVVDPEGEYTQMAWALGGATITVDFPHQDINSCISNPSQQASEQEYIQGLRQLMAVLLGNALSPQLGRSLNRALAAYITLPHPNTGLKYFVQWLGDNGYGQLAGLLAPIASEYGPQPDSTPQGQPFLGASPLTVYDLHLLPPEERPQAIINCAESVMRRASEASRPRVLVLDEVSPALSTAEAGDSLMRIAKRCRTFNLALVTTSQDIEQCLPPTSGRQASNSPGEALVRNAAAKLLLGHTPAAAARLAGFLGLDQDQERWICTCPPGSGLFMTALPSTPAADYHNPSEGPQTQHALIPNGETHDVRIRIAQSTSPVRIDLSPKEAPLIEWIPLQGTSSFGTGNTR